MEDLFNLVLKNSLARQRLDKGESIILSDYPLERIDIPSEFKTREIYLPNEELSTLREQVTSIVKPFENDFGHNLFTVVYEAMLNAYQHGNKSDPSKKIRVGHKLTKKTERGKMKLEMMVEDSGGVIDPRFIAFILQHRSTYSRSQFINWYEFSGLEKKPNSRNEGLGTSHIHAYTDEVNYYASKSGGLILHFLKSVYGTRK